MSATRALPIWMRPVGEGAKRTIGEVMSKLRQEFCENVRRGKILAPQPFCQVPTSLSVGILTLPRPGLARRRDRQTDAPLRLRRESSTFGA